jgi:hypothetical protein
MNLMVKLNESNLVKIWVNLMAKLKLNLMDQIWLKCE